MSNANAGKKCGRYMNWTLDAQLLVVKSNFITVRDLMNLMRRCLTLDMELAEDKAELTTLIRDFMKTRLLFGVKARFPDGLYVDGNAYVDIFSNLLLKIATHQNDRYATLRQAVRDLNTATISYDNVPNKKPKIYHTDLVERELHLQWVE
ncbi:hypothetical protein JYU34_009309 [Plutella xylostella]|uniref:Uncharacterized protein n=1 Tax=Plutella xylostella TaxID=51655 RepID=A0ABQ7QJ58_PLUXY|nr:hypothetical protein JYU34_009309 [Plutella xylostella]